MSRTVSATFKSAVFGQETSEIFIVLLELDHDDLASPIRVSSNAVDTVSNGNTFVAYPFMIDLPDDQDSSASVGKITIDNVDQSIVQAIRAIQSPPDITIQIVLFSDVDTVEAEWTGFELINVGYDSLTVSGDISIESFLNEAYPSGSFLPSKFPGLF
jgi:hypothetical protein